MSHPAPPADMAHGKPDMAAPGKDDMSVPPPSDMGTMSDMSSDAGAPSDCEYPMGSFGFKQGNVLDPSLSWNCYAPGEDTPKKLTAKDLLDCDGKRGINGIMIDSSALDCVPCQNMAKSLNSDWQENDWGTLGVTVVIMVADSKAADPSGSINSAKKWRDDYNLKEHFYVCDSTPTSTPNYGFYPSLPVVNPRTMKFDFVPTVQTFDQGEAKVTALAKKNKK